MKKNQTYRSGVAVFLTALLCLVFFWQGLHPLFGHHNQEEDCTFDGVHIHADHHHHFSCAICVFRFLPTDLETHDLTISQPNYISSKHLFDCDEILFTQKLLQSYLRGPPGITRQ